MKNFYKTAEVVDFSQVDSNLFYRIDAIVSDFQKITAFHSKEMGVDGETTKEKSNAFWVLSKLKLNVLSLPKIYDQVSLVTYPTTVSAVRFMREYKISGDGRDCVLGKSEWCTLDCDSKMIRKTNTICYPFELEHLKENPDCTDFKKPKETVSEEHFCHDHKILYVDIDSNGHTNNVSYVKMALNCFLPNELGEETGEFEIYFLSQSYYGDCIKVYKKPTEYGYYVEGKLNDKAVFSCVIALKK